jgi:hypothetical protein
MRMCLDVPKIQQAGVLAGVDFGELWNRNHKFGLVSHLECPPAKGAKGGRPVSLSSGRGRRHPAPPSLPPFCSACGLAGILACRTVTMVPSLFIDNLKAFSTSFTLGHHEDAHEFFISVLDHLNRHRSLDTDTFAVGDVTFVDSVFGCSIHTVYGCPCLHSSTSIDPYYSLGLRPTIVDALRDFMAESIESYTCSSCTRFGSCTSRSFFDPTALPAVLTLHLKRFTNDRLKLSAHVQFDDTLDLGPFTVDQTTALYTLFAVVVHTGERLSNGHFYTFARAPTSPLQLRTSSPVMILWMRRHACKSRTGWFKG